jgi:hypothetical protein
MSRTNEITPEYIEMFWEKVDIKSENECWPWKMFINADGYGQVRLGNMQIASRVAYMITNGLLPLSIRVMHTCDNRSCCNPSHLIAAPQKENILDMEKKGRGRHTGWDHRKLLEEEVIDIREMWSAGVMAKDIAEKYGVTPDIIYRIRMGRTYKKWGGPIDPINRHGGKK